MLFVPVIRQGSAGNLKDDYGKRPYRKEGREYERRLELIVDDYGIHRIEREEMGKKRVAVECPYPWPVQVVPPKNASMIVPSTPAWTWQEALRSPLRSASCRKSIAPLEFGQVYHGFSELVECFAHSWAQFSEGLGGQDHAFAVAGLTAGTQHVRNIHRFSEYIRLHDRL